MRRRSFASTLNAIAREAARAERARLRLIAQQEAAQRRAILNAQRQAKLDAKEAAQAYIASQMDEAETLTAEVKQRDDAIDTLLFRSLDIDPGIDVGGLKKRFIPRQFDDRRWRVTPPLKASFYPKPFGFFARLMPGAAKKWEAAVADGEQRFAAAVESYESLMEERRKSFEKFEEEEKNREKETQIQNDAIVHLFESIRECDHQSIISFYDMVFDKALSGDEDAESADVGYAVDSRHLVVDVNLPAMDVIPDCVGFKYNKSKDEIEKIDRSYAKRKSSYSTLISKIILKSVDCVFRADKWGVVECVTVNGKLSTIDPATGQTIQVCLVSVRVTVDGFKSINLRLVQPEQCLRSLKAVVSRYPSELLPVKPIVELDMIDPRFVDTTDVMSNLESRQNLMELSPNEFEALITNLFASMGLDTRQTRPSRDGGVDCVAFDPRPVFGGKVVIQAKRYKNTVGVSAVRDLFGTVQNEGASKGILVTTSGYGRAAYDFANGKPLELLDGGNLLHLLSEHAGIDARIVVPDSWIDRPIHGE